MKITLKQRDWIYEEIMDSIERTKNNSVDDVYKKLTADDLTNDRLEVIVTELIDIMDRYEKSIELCKKILCNGKTPTQDFMDRTKEKMKKSAEDRGEKDTSYIDDMFDPYKWFTNNLFNDALNNKKKN